MDTAASEKMESNMATLHQEDIHKDKWLDRNEARNAFHAEHNVGLWTAIKLNYRGVLWSFFISTAIIMEGYDTALISNFFAYPSFVKHYGQYFNNINEYQLSSPWQVGLVNGSNAGVIIGGFINGWASSRFGYRRTILVAMMAMICFLFIIFFSPNSEVLVAGEILCGIPLGVFATTGPAYASEVLPLALRSYLTIYVNMCWAAGQLIASGILQGLVNDSSQWSYRIPWAIQWVWPPFLILGAIFAPESPWWLIRNDRISEAERTLHRLSNASDEEIRGTLAQMVHTVNIEREVTAGQSYLACFKGTDLRRTEISCLTFMTQMFAGAQFAYGPTYFFEQAGMSTDQAYKVGIGSTALAFLGTGISWIWVSYFGRRTIYLSGIASLSVILLIIGIVSVSSTSAASLWTQAALCLIWQLVYAMTLGGVCYTIISETSAVGLRAKTVVLSRNAYNMTSIVCAILEPYMMNPTQWNWKGKTGFFWAGTASIMTVWVYFRLPECGGKTYEELDLLFHKKVPARKFKATHVDPYAEEDDAVKSL